MFLRTRRIFVLSSVLALAACASAGPAATTPAAGADQTRYEAFGGQMVFHKVAIHPNAGAPPLIMNFVADGPNQGGVPCIGCVSGATTSDTVGMTGPISYVLSNTYWQYAISFTDLTYKGKCKLAWSITAGKNTIDSFSASLNIPNAGGFIIYALARSRPKYSGAATLTGGYTCGKNKGSAQAPLYFE